MDESYINLPAGYTDESDDHEIVITDPNGSIFCDILVEDDAIAIRYALAKWEKSKNKSEGLFAVAALLFINKKVVSVSRKTNHEDFGLPGGKIDPGETPREALIRELQEEIGITAKKFRVVYEDLDRVESGELRPCRTYLIEEWEGEPQATNENAVVKMVNPEFLFEKHNSFCNYNIALFDHLKEQGMDYLWKEI